jgi:hypothetical protein
MQNDEMGEKYRTRGEDGICVPTAKPEDLKESFIFGDPGVHVRMMLLEDVN